MADRKALIKELIEMQNKFIAEEHANGFNAKSYFTPEAGSVYEGYRETYNTKSMELVDAAHADKGSHR